MKHDLNDEDIFESTWDYQDISNEGETEFQPFYRRIIQDVLCNEESDAPVCAPACMILWLAVLAELSSGRTRKQILDAVGMADMSSFSQAADAMWNAETTVEKGGICRLSSSIWLNQGKDGQCSRQTALEKQLELCHTDIFAGEAGSDFMNRELRKWLNECTGGKLKNQVSGISLGAQVQAALFSAIYFNARWRTGWLGVDFTEQHRAVFHGEDRNGKCQMMKDTTTLPYFRGEQFGAVCLYLSCRGRSVFLILPDKNVSPNTVLKSRSFYELMELGEDYPDWDLAEIKLYLPQIRADAKIDLIPYLKREGIRDVFDAQAADFSPLLEMDNLSGPLYVSEAEHCVHLAWDDYGVEGAAYAGGQYTGATMPEKKVTFRLNRPFLYLITGCEGTPLFVGAVRNL